MLVDRALNAEGRMARQLLLAAMRPVCLLLEWISRGATEALGRRLALIFPRT
jgi:hypothetical protein